MYEIPEEYCPELDTTEESDSSESGSTRYQDSAGITRIKNNSELIIKQVITT
jgi:hypothetical protein